MDMGQLYSRIRASIKVSGTTGRFTDKVDISLESTNITKGAFCIPSHMDMASK